MSIDSDMDQFLIKKMTCSQLSLRNVAGTEKHRKYTPYIENKWK